MSEEKIIRAWKDEEYRNSLGAEELAGLPENPAGLVELPDEELRDIAGGLPLTINYCTKWNTCYTYCMRTYQVQCGTRFVCG